MCGCVRPAGMYLLGVGVRAMKNLLLTSDGPDTQLKIAGPNPKEVRVFSWKERESRSGMELNAPLLTQLPK